MASIEEALRLIGESACQDRAYLFEIHKEKSMDRVLMSQRCEWTSEGTEPEIGNPDLINVDATNILPRWMTAFRQNEIIEGPVKSFPETEQALLLPQAIVSLLCVPIFDEKRLCGFIGFDNCHMNYRWTAEDKALLRTIAAAIGAAMGRQQNLLQLQEGEEKFQKLINGNPAVAVQGFYEDGRITFWNQASEVFFGYAAEEVVGSNSFDLLVPPKDMDFIQGKILELKHQDEDKRQAFQATYLHKDGHDVPVLTCLVSLEKKHRDTEYFAFELDLTEQKKLESQLLRNQRLEAIGSLASGIAHDLNNVLAPMLMSLDTLELEREKNEGLGSVADIIDQCTNRAVDMSRKLLTIAKGSEVKMEEVDLYGLLDGLIQFLRNTFPRNVEISYEYVDEIPALQGDVTQIHQILLNLALNARDAMPKGGELHFKISKQERSTEPAGALGDTFVPGPHTVIEVSDTGTGMDSETLMKVFEPFFTTKGSEKGTGIGLSTTLSILKSHKAWILPQSFPGVGTTFRIFLPMQTQTIPGEGGALEPDKVPEGCGETVLVVDDEEAIRGVVSDVLQGYHYHTFQAENGQQALDIFAEHPEITLVITDLMMPVMDGTTAMRHLRESRPTLPIIATSGMSSTNVDTDSAQELADEFLSKPFRASSLLQTVRKLLDQTS